MEALFDGTGWAGWAGAGVPVADGLVGTFGMYSGPVWPQPDSANAAAARERSASVDFTIRMTV